MFKRWPFLMGNGCGNSTLQPPPSAPHSAFKAMPSTCPNSLPPISSLREREGGTGTTTTLALPQAHHAHQLVNQEARARAMMGQGHTLQHDMKMCGIPPGMGAHGIGAAGLSAPGLGLTGTPATSHPMPHPAFPLPLTSLAQHPHPDALSPLHHLMSGNKALALTHYLTDPLAKAALMDLGRYGHYPMGKKLFGCPQCRYVTDRKNNLKRHVATMHQECDKVLECCGVAFKNKASLRDHVLIFHSNGYMCRFCGRNFCRKALLKRHLTVHSGQKDYVCPLCDYATSHKSNLERHKKVHERQGSDQEDNDNDTPMHSPSNSYSSHHGHAHVHSSHPSAHAYNRDIMASARVFPPSHSTSGFNGHLKQNSPGETSTRSHSVSTTTNPMNNNHDNHSNHHHISRVTSSSSPTMTQSTTNNTSSLLMTKDAFDLQMTSLGQSDMGSYSVDRILNTYKHGPNVAIGGIDVDLDDSDSDDPRALLDDDDDDDDDDTHSSGLIDVVHVDIHE